MMGLILLMHYGFNIADAWWDIDAARLGIDGSEHFLLYRI
jgi:hypothetical protein